MDSCRPYNEPFATSTTLPSLIDKSTQQASDFRKQIRLLEAGASELKVRISCFSFFSFCALAERTFIHIKTSFSSGLRYG